MSISLVVVIVIVFIKIIIVGINVVGLGQIIGPVEIELRQMIADQGLGQRPFLGGQAGDFLQIVKILGPERHGLQRVALRALPDEPPEPVPRWVDRHGLGDTDEIQNEAAARLVIAFRGLEHKRTDQRAGQVGREPGIHPKQAHPQ